MREQEFRYHHCKKKEAFRSEQRAMNQIEKFKKRGYIVSPLANAYKCKYCGKWHLGHRKEVQNATEKLV